ncbi:MAG: DUF4390 domain-containing protein [Nitrospirae bacterium]|nr:DUF4390 domain-containing protein [Nitrospirota bacterium]
MVNFSNNFQSGKLFTLIFCAYLISTASAATAEIIGPAIKIQNNNIMIGTGFSNIKEIENAIKSGVEKEIVFTIELFREWDFWPDEFVHARKIQKVIKYDNLRGQYRTSSHDGTVVKERYFKEFNDLKEWLFTVKDVNLINVKELEQGKYFVRVVVESKSREIPPVIGFFMLFIPEIETSLAKKSPTFVVGEHPALRNPR